MVRAEFAGTRLWRGIVRAQKGEEEAGYHAARGGETSGPCVADIITLPPVRVPAKDVLPQGLRASA